MKGQRKLFHVPRMFMTATTEMMDGARGNTICQYICTCPAPSMRADSKRMEIVY
jgi:hypothetical protein